MVNRDTARSYRKHFCRKDTMKFPARFCYWFHRGRHWSKTIIKTYKSEDKKLYFHEFNCNLCNCVRLIKFYQCVPCNGYFRDKHHHETHNSWSIGRQHTWSERTCTYEEKQYTHHSTWSCWKYQVLVSWLLGKIQRSIWLVRNARLDNGRFTPCLRIPAR